MRKMTCPAVSAFFDEREGAGIIIPRGTTKTKTETSTAKPTRSFV